MVNLYNQWVDLTARTLAALTRKIKVARSGYPKRCPDAQAGALELELTVRPLVVAAMPTAFQPLVILRDMVVMFVFSVLSTLYPILKINRYRPVEAMRHV